MLNSLKVLPDKLIGIKEQDKISIIGHSLGG